MKGCDSNMMAVEYIHKLIYSGQQAIKNIDKDDHKLKVLDIQKSLGELDKVKHDLEAAQCLLREELKMRRGDYDEED